MSRKTSIFGTAPLLPWSRNVGINKSPGIYFQSLFTIGARQWLWRLNGYYEQYSGRLGYSIVTGVSTVSKRVYHAI